MTKNTLSNRDDVIDSWDIVARIEELESDRQLFTPDYSGTESEPSNSEQTWAEANEDDAAELVMLTALVEEIDQNAGDSAKDGVTLIRDSYFEDYARELADDLGLLTDNESWPYTCIDWEKAARELRMDYFTVEFDGVTYWLR